MSDRRSTNLSSTLTQLGLSEKEAKFYLALLETGPSTVLPVAKKAGMKRTSIYNFVDHLVELGLVSFYVKNNRHYYKAEDPEYINELLSKQQQKIKSILPNLKNLYQTKDYHPQTKLFYGVEGMKKAINESLECEEKKLYFIIDINSAVGNLGIKFWDSYTGEVVERKIIAHTLRHLEQKTRIPNYKYLKKNQYKNTTLIPRYLPSDIKVPNTMAIYDNKVVIISPREENWALVVESQSFSESMKVFHKALWQVSK